MARAMFSFLYACLWDSESDNVTPIGAFFLIRKWRWGWVWNACAKNVMSLRLENGDSSSLFLLENKPNTGRGSPLKIFSRIKMLLQIS